MALTSKDLQRMGPKARQQVERAVRARETKTRPGAPGAAQRSGCTGERTSKEAGTVFAKGGNGEKRTLRGRNKYHAKPTDVVMQDGTVRHFASEKEAARFRELDLLQRAGEISGLRCQVEYELIPYQTRADGKREQPCKYIADFVYRDGCRVVVEDVKGYDDPKSAAYRLFTVKRKLMLMVHGITIREV